MKVPIGYCKQFVLLFGFSKGLKLYLKLRLGKIRELDIPSLNSSLELRNNDVDFKVFCQVFVNQEYNIQFDFKPKRIIDAGANIGLFSLFIKSVYIDSEVCAIEPDLENFELLQRNTKHLTSHKVIQKGLWHKRANLSISDPYKSGKWAMMVNEVDNGEISAIDVDSVLKIMNWDSIDLFKIDIEGSEKELFSENYEEWLPKTKVLIVECHDWMKPNCTKTLFTAINKTMNTYRVELYGENLVIFNIDLE